MDGKILIFVEIKHFKTSDIITHNNKNVNIITPKRTRSDKQTKKMIKKLKEQIKIIDLILKNLKDTDKIGKRYLNYICKKISIENKIKELNIKQKPVYTKKETEILNKRHLVENNYNSLKKSERITIRKDHKIKNFMSFIFIVELKRLTLKYADKLHELKLNKF